MTIEEVNDRIKEVNDKLDDRIDRISDTIKELNSSISNLSKKLDKANDKIRLILAKHTSEIRVLEKDGSWGGYTGIFYTDKKDNAAVVAGKAMNHYKTYFEDRDFYAKKTLALFISNDKGKKIVKILQDPKKRLDEHSKLKEETVNSIKEYFKNGGENVSTR